MASARPPADPGPSARVGEFDLLAYLGAFLATPESHFVMLNGPVGAGKSSLLKQIVPLVRGPKIFLAFAPASASPPPGSASGLPGSPVPMLVVDPQQSSEEGPPAAGSPGSPSSMLAFSPTGSDGSAEAPPAFARAVSHLDAAGAGTVIVDSWDRGSDAYFRSQATTPAGAQTFSMSPSAMAALQAELVSSRHRLILAVTPDMGGPLLSTADAVLELGDEAQAGTRIRVLRVAKVRGNPPPTPTLVYSLDGGRFRAYPPLPPGYRPPIGAADEDPEPTASTCWPGSAAFARAFGRLRYGGSTAISLSPDCPESVPLALTVPLVQHVLRVGGRAVWVPSPSSRPVRIVKHLRDALPAEWIVERLRILSPLGSDPALEDLRSVVLPLTRPSGASGGVREAPPSGVRPLFPEIFRFLETRHEATPAVLFVSLDGLRAAWAAAGVSTIDASTLPAVLGAYARVPQFHAFGYGSADDPAAPYFRPMVDTLLELEVLHGRPILFGIRPRTSALLLDWPDRDGRYQLVPVS
jgi:hypothetical protein